jgi:hypothetical protein
MANEPNRKIIYRATIDANGISPQGDTELPAEPLRGFNRALEGALQGRIILLRYTQFYHLLEVHTGDGVPSEETIYRAQIGSQVILQGTTQLSPEEVRATNRTITDFFISPGPFSRNQSDQHLRSITIGSRREYKPTLRPGIDPDLFA